MASTLSLAQTASRKHGLPRIAVSLLGTGQVGGALADWDALQAAAQSAGTHYGDAATVGAGLPALSTLRRLQHAGDTLIALIGVFSGSLSFLFNAFDGRRPFSSLLAEARALGY